MSKHQRPWWLLVNKPAGLITTVQEESASDEQVFVIRGEPVVQGLAWLTWGPAAALLFIILLTGLAIVFNVRGQSSIMRFFFVAAFLALPALAWGLAIIVFNRLAAKHLQAERKAKSQECRICLNQKRGEFSYQIIDQTLASSIEEKLAYGNIRGAKVTPVIGARNRKAMRLILNTDQGMVVLLNEALGTPAQKIDLAREIEALLKL